LESFESFVALAMEAEGLVVSGPHKFPIKAKTKRAAFDEYQVHGREIDLIGASADRLVLATVKSFLGSQGVKANEVRGISGKTAGYAMINNPALREQMIASASARFGYSPSQVELRLYAGKFQSPTAERDIREWAREQRAGSGPIGVFGPLDYVDVVRALAESTTYIDHPIIAAIKVMNFADTLKVKAEKKQPKVGAGGVEREFPLGSSAESTSDGFGGIVVGYNNPNEKIRYVRILDEATGVSKLRSAKTLLNVS